MNFDKYDTIIWDWNGTLLDDVEMCIACMNQLLQVRGIPLINKELYQEVFTFPVQDYYQKIGIDFEKEPFEVIGHQFMDLYFEAIPSCRLHHGVEEVLKYYMEQGKRQFILSAMEQESLLKSLKNYDIESYFEGVYGIDNHLAAGKMGRAHQMMKEFSIEASTSLMFGDTIHDKEVADEIKIDIAFIAHGHQSIKKLKDASEIVFSDLNSMITLSGLY